MQSGTQNKDYKKPVAWYFLKQPQYTGKGYFMNPNANRLFLYHGRLPETHITEDEERLFQAEPRADIIARKPEYR